MAEDESAAMDIEWIRKALENGKKRGKTRSGLAKALGRNPSAVTALLDGTRTLKASEIAIIADYFDSEPPDLRPNRRIDTVMIVGEVAAGVWKEAHADTFDERPTTIPIMQGYSKEAIYALEVRGTSINRRADDGDLVVCLDVHHAPREPRHGDYVIARRRRNGSAEHTVKQLRITPAGVWELWPDSNDPHWQEPVFAHSPERDDDHADDHAEIIAFVINFVSPATVL